MKFRQFDPRIFINKPYIECPKCGKNSFGIVGIFDYHYCRRCKECLFPSRFDPSASFPLPKLSKKVIYIDQFAISEMMKSLKLYVEKKNSYSDDSFWLELFKKLDVLCKLQLIICPNSFFHVDESIVCKYYKELKRMYELLSHGVTFHFPSYIKEAQVYQHVHNWLDGKGDRELDIDIQSGISGNISGWQARFIISLNSEYLYDFVDDIRKDRTRNHLGLIGVFKHWQNETGRSFDDWYTEEWMSLGMAMLKSYLLYSKELAMVFSGEKKFTANSLEPPFGASAIVTIERALKKEGLIDNELVLKAYEYLASPYLEYLPFNKIASLLYAAIARKAASGQKRFPNAGMANDIQMISVLVPYCNAMFIDKECHALLSENPVCDRIDYNTKLFSANNKEELLSYLDEIKSMAPRDHLLKVREVYGDGWDTPFTDLYKDS